MRYFLLYKPYGVLSQFTRETPAQRTLADLGFPFPPDVYPVGRLDADSEGLLLLTNDKALNARLLDPRHGHPRTYLVQVEGQPTGEALDRLRAGVDIRIDGKVYRTRPAAIELENDFQFSISNLPSREPPIRFRKSIPTSWLQITLTEGKNRQVRRMCAAVGLPVLRLVRVAIGNIGLKDLGEVEAGVVREVDRGFLGK